jgi:phosphatidylserine/phosphatidylglycerophosphate/cardiolipin synthase-like enzyme
LTLIPKFTKGDPSHPYHPRHFVHEQIDRLIRKKKSAPKTVQTIKACVDCIDDTDFVNHLIYASENDVKVQCVVDWRKTTLTRSENYARVKRSGIELLGVFCTPRDSLIELPPDMHTKFMTFGEEDSLLGSFNMTFDRWWANWETGVTSHSYGVARLLDNIFQSVRGGVIQRYGIDPLSPFNLLYTFGRHAMLNGKYYRPHHAIISEIHRARSSIKACLFLLGELWGEYGDTVTEALLQAKRRGVEIRLIFNGHMARQGDPGRECSMKEELSRPLLPAIARLKGSGISVALAYGVNDPFIPYSPLHSKYCIIDDRVVLDGSFNWYNTSVFSHDLLIVAKNAETASPYLYEFNQILNAFKIYWI